MTSQQLLPVTTRSLGGMRVGTPFGDVETKPAPGALARVQALINTRDLEKGVDLLADPVQASQWLSDHGLAPPREILSRENVGAVVAVREALRALTIHSAGGPAPTIEALRGLQDVTGQATARAVLDEHGSIRLEPTADSVRGRLLSLLLQVRDAQADGTWAHLKACANPDCLWAFYDRSRNHGGTWCTMAGCGNKLKNRDFRARRRTD